MNRRRARRERASVVDWGKVKLLRSSCAKQLRMQKSCIGTGKAIVRHGQGYFQGELDPDEPSIVRILGRMVFLVSETLYN